MGALALGPMAWLSGYIVLPLAQVHKPIWQYDARTLGDDLSAHLVYGSAASVRPSRRSGFTDRGLPTPQGDDMRTPHTTSIEPQFHRSTGSGSAMPTAVAQRSR